MHYLLYVLGADTDDLENSLDVIMRPYNEELYPDHINPIGRWDWWEVGGRWDGELTPSNTTTVGQLLQMPEANSPWALVIPGLWLERETWTGKAFVPHPDFDSEYRRILQALPPTTTLTVVDYHS